MVQRYRQERVVACLLLTRLHAPQYGVTVGLLSAVILFLFPAGNELITRTLQPSRLTFRAFGEDALLVRAIMMDNSGEFRNYQ